jgi:hypothetical protein
LQPACESRMFGQGGGAFAFLTRECLLALELVPWVFTRAFTSGVFRTIVPLRAPESPSTFTCDRSRNMSRLPREFTNALRSSKEADIAAILRVLSVQAPNLDDIDSPSERLARLRETYGEALSPFVASIQQKAPLLHVRTMKSTPDVIVSGSAHEWKRLLPWLKDLQQRGMVALIPNRPIHLVRDL